MASSSSTPAARVKVAFQGERGAYSEAAATEMFAVAAERGRARLAIEAIPCNSFEDCFNALLSSAVTYAVVPIENTLGGSIHGNYDLLLRHHGAIHIIGEHSFRVRHALLAPKGCTRDSIKKVMSHPQALAQCDGFIRRHSWERMPAYDTAGSAKMIAEQGLRDTAAICSVTAAELFGLEVIDHGIEDDANNFTRFLLLHTQPVAPPLSTPCKTTIVFQPSTNEAGILFKALSVFALRGLDLCKIESRPGRRTVTARPADSTAAARAGAVASPAAKRARSDADAPPTPADGGGSAAPGAAQFEYTFWLDLTAHAHEEKVANALRHLGEIAPFVFTLGCFPFEGIMLPGDPASIGPKEDDTALAAMRKSAVRHTMPLRVGILGFGNFGQFLAEWFVAAGHSLFAASRSDYAEVASKIGVTFFRDTAQMLRARARGRRRRAPRERVRPRGRSEPRAASRARPGRAIGGGGARTAARACRRSEAGRAHPRAVHHLLREGAGCAPARAARGPARRGRPFGQDPAQAVDAARAAGVVRHRVHAPDVRARVGQGGLA